MPRLKEREETYFTTIRGMCRRCRSVAPARVYFRDGKVWGRNLCVCGPQDETLIADDVSWYLSEVVRPRPDRSPLPGSTPSKRGCPHDCGPCSWHASPCQLPVLSITNACNLRCPICFTYNRDDRLFNISVEEMSKTVDWIIESSGAVDLINLTGGEPTLHPDLFDILQTCKRPEIGRITMNSNGVRLAEDYDLCRRLADLNVCVILSFNTFDSATSRMLHGCDLTKIKLKAIENLAKAGVRMTLLQVLIRGVNENAVSGIFKLMDDYENILSLTVQTMTYTGQGGGSFQKAQPIPIDEAARIISRESNGALQFDDFFSRPSAHPLCYLVSYVLKAEGRLLPFTRFASKERIQKLLHDSYLLRVGDSHDFFVDAINQLYAEGNDDSLKTLRRIVERLYPSDRSVNDFERQRIAESAVRTIYLHAHMDEDSFDCSRAALCPDLVPAEPGRLIPACTYNLFYRMKDPRFYDARLKEETP